jgi:hypothetical protein
MRIHTNSTTSTPSCFSSPPLHAILLFLLLLLVGLGGEKGARVVDAQQQDAFACLDSQGNLLTDTAIQDRTCTTASQAVFYYDIQPAPITANGLQAGAPTDLHLWFGSIGNPIETAFDPRNFGLGLPVNGRLIVDFGPQFLYDNEQANIPIPNRIVELGLAMGNAVLGEPCNYRDDVERALIVCGGWTAGFGDNTTANVTATANGTSTNFNQVVYTTAMDQGLTGERGQLIGAKFAHVHPQFGTASGLYHNANGTCFNISSANINDSINNNTTYCRFDSECPDSQTCVTAPSGITASITVTVVDDVDDIVHKAVRRTVFTAQPRFAVFPTNAGLFAYQELAETVDFQHVYPDTICENIARVDNLFSAGAPYAPRFFLFGPQSSDFGFPHPIVSDLIYEIDTDNDTTGTLRNGTTVIGTVELLQPAGAGGILVVSNNSGLIGNGPAALGGTLFAVPVQVGSILGLYTVRVTMVDGAVADSRIVVDEATSSPTLAPSAMPSVAPSVSPSVAPSVAPSIAPSAMPSTIPTGASSLSPSFGPTDSPTEASAASRWLGHSTLALVSVTLAFILIL